MPTEQRKDNLTLFTLDNLQFGIVLQWENIRNSVFSFLQTIRLIPLGLEQLL